MNNIYIRRDGVPKSVQKCTRGTRGGGGGGSGVGGGVQT